MYGVLLFPLFQYKSLAIHFLKLILKAISNLPSSVLIGTRSAKLPLLYNLFELISLQRKHL